MPLLNYKVMLEVLIIFINTISILAPPVLVSYYYYSRTNTDIQKSTPMYKYVHSCTFWNNTNTTTKTTPPQKQKHFNKNQPKLTKKHLTFKY